jgi:hypothetical protein
LREALITGSPNYWTICPAEQLNPLQQPSMDEE